jgi:hypothetical protein
MDGTQRATRQHRAEATALETPRLHPARPGTAGLPYR